MTPFWPDGQRIEVRCEQERPLSFHWGRGENGIRDLSEHWRVRTAWWEMEIWCNYWEVTTNTGLLAVIYQDLLSNGWYLERIYE